MNTATSHDVQIPGVAKSLCKCVAVVIGSWICGMLGPLAFLVPIVLIGSMVYFLRRRLFSCAGFLLITTPMSLYFLSGIVDYANGCASLRYPGLPGTTFHNLDPELRCGRSSSGCILSGNEWLTHSPYNCAVRIMTTCFGWMPNTYDGPYPTEDEARKCARGGEPVSLHDLVSDRLTIGGESIELDPGVGKILAKCFVFRDDAAERPTTHMTAAIWKRECVVVRVPARSAEEGAEPSAVIALISRSAGRPFAWYSEGDYEHRYPPVTWKRP